MDWLLAISVTVTVILACVAASRGREIRRVSADLKSSVDRANREWHEAIERHQELNREARVFESTISVLEERVDCLTADRDFHVEGGARLAEENAGLKQSYLAIHNGLTERLGFIASLGYSNKKGPLTRSKAWAKLKELERI